MNQHEQDKIDRHLSIDRIVENQGTQILSFIMKHGVLVEGQFSFAKPTFDRELGYLWGKLTEKFIDIIDDEDYIGLECRFFPSSSEIEHNYFYYAILKGHDNASEEKTSKKIALQVYKNEVLSKFQTD